MNNKFNIAIILICFLVSCNASSFFKNFKDGSKKVHPLNTVKNDPKNVQNDSIEKTTKLQEMDDNQSKLEKIELPKPLKTSVFQTENQLNSNEEKDRVNYYPSKADDGKESELTIKTFISSQHVVFSDDDNEESEDTEDESGQKDGEKAVSNIKDTASDTSEKGQDLVNLKKGNSRKLNNQYFTFETSAITMPLKPDSSVNSKILNNKSSMNHNTPGYPLCYYFPVITKRTKIHRMASSSDDDEEKSAKNAVFDKYPHSSEEENEEIGEKNNWKNSTKKPKVLPVIFPKKTFKECDYPKSSFRSKNILKSNRLAFLIR